MELAAQNIHDPHQTANNPQDILLNFDQPLLTIEETLESFGILKNEIKIYLYLAKEGAKKAKDICDTVEIHRTETYRILRNLEKKGLIFFILGKPVQFSAVPLDEALDLLIAAQKTKLQILENQKEVLLDLWALRPQKKRPTMPQRDLFQKLKGEQQIIQKANEVLKKANASFEVFVSDQYINDLYYGGFFDTLKKLDKKLDVVLLTPCSQKSTYFLDQIKWPQEKRRMVQEWRLPCFMISDHSELLVAFTEEESPNELGHKKKLKNVAVWTNYRAVVSTFEMLFLKLL